MSGIQWTVLIILAVLGAGAVGVLWWRRRPVTIDGRTYTDPRDLRAIRAGARPDAGSGILMPTLDGVALRPVSTRAGTLAPAGTTPAGVYSPDPAGNAGYGG